MAAFRFSTLSRTRLRAGLALLFLALAVPTAVLVRQAYSQLKWESFHQYRNLAEDLTARIDAELSGLIEEAEAHSFSDYSFLVVEGDTANNFLQRSPLSRYPVDDAFPGNLGFFQVDGDGQFSTPLLPAPGTETASLGMSAGEVARRRELARRIAEVLRDNRLVQGTASLADAPLPEEVAASAGTRDRPSTGAPEGPARGQAAFDALSATQAGSSASPAAVAPAATDENARAARASSQRQANTLGKVADLKLETPFESKADDSREPDRRIAQETDRASRKEQEALPEVAAGAVIERLEFNQRDVRVDTFESEIDPMEFSLLDSGHFVLFRKVWRDRERFVQGMLIEREAFMRQMFDRLFNGSVVAAMSDLVIAYDDDVIYTHSGRESADYTTSMLRAPAPLLYRTRLSSPLDRLELIYRIRHLPPGPGASVLGWLSLVLAAVFCGGFFALYRLASGQIALARQQQDFVSAVSHELKTPLTSIRMYGEMLKEGWATAEKRQQYYEYIYDESERLTRLIGNVLQLASITRSKPKLDLKPVHAGELMRDIEARISDPAKRGGFELRIEMDADSDAAMVSADVDSFVQIIINLVDNAIKFSRKAATRVIEVSARVENDGYVRFSVRDFGPGVPDSQMKKIFRLFYRSESELTRETVGTGIGLAIVHELTRAMHGKVDVVNRDPGAEFMVFLPRVAG